MNRDFSSIVEVLNFNSEEIKKNKFCIDLSTNKEYSYQEFDVLVNRCANFISDNLKDTKIVSSALKNSIEGLIVFFAAQKAGGSINPMPHSLSQSEIEKNIEFIKPDILFIEGSVQFNKIVNEGLTVTIKRKEDSFLSMISTYSDSFDFMPSKDDTAAFYYTSGTTSNPKCIEYTHGNQISLIDSICRGFSYSSESVHLGILPIGHTAITNYQLLPVIFQGATLYLAESYMDVRRNFWEIVFKNKITNIQTVPTVLEMIINTPTKFEDFKSLSMKYVGCGSAPLTPELQNKFLDKFSIPVANLYGLSESGPSHFDDPLEENWKPGSIGTQLDVNDCKIIKEDMSFASQGEIGQICLKGKNIFKGYYKNSKATNEAMHNGYFLTGDIGYENSEGKFFFSDRSKDLIIKGGVNIFPGEIEEVIYKIPGVRLVAVLGIPDNIYGEEIHAFIQKETGSLLSEDDVARLCGQSLQKMKIPKKVTFIDEMPKTASGKILKRNLR